MSSDAMSRDPMSRDDVAALVCVRLAREVDDGDLIVLGSFTPMAYSAYLLAKATHAPGAFVVAYSALDVAPFSLSLMGTEAGALAAPAGRIEMIDVVHRIHQRGRGDVEAVSAPQMDGELRFNYAWIGPGGDRPLRLPGGAGAPEVIHHHRKLLAYFPRHRPEVLCGAVDYVSATRPPERLAATRILTDLAVLAPRDGRLAVESIHPGVTRAQVDEATGFPLVWPDEVEVTVPPSEAELDALRRVDPQGTLRLEFVDGRGRRSLLRELLDAEERRADRYRAAARG